MSIGTRIQEARLKNKMRRPELAERLKVTPSAISNYENDISSPKIEILYAIMEVLRVDANFLFQDVVTYRDESVFTLRESEHIKKYRALDERGQGAVDNTLEYEYSRVTEAAEQKKRGAG